MSQYDAEREDTTIYRVVVNHEEQYSIWPEYKDNPLGWKDVGKAGPKAECLAFIKEVWTDMRPLSLRKRMEEMARNPAPPPPPPSTRASEPSLVDRLCDGKHPVAVSLRPEKTAKLFRDAIERNFVHIKFLDTKGGTELGVRLDRDACDLTSVDCEAGTGSVHIEGGLTLDYVRVRCIADLDLSTMEGTGYLVKVAAKADG